MRHSQPRAQKGFTLIEAMIAIVIFAVGLLAVASLQGVAKKASFEAVQRTSAVHLAESLLERMRANPTALENYMANQNIRILSEAAPPTVTVGCNIGWPNVGCDAATLAGVDVAQWWNLVVGATELVGGVPVGGLVQPTVCLLGESDGATGLYAVAIAWRGTTEVDQTGSNPCGSGDPAYGEFRRVVVVGSYLNAL